MNKLTRALTIGIIEDNADLCQGWRDIFALDGHRVHCYYTGGEALNDLATLATCDVIVSDYYLPDVNGVELINKIRKVRPQLPIILLTGSKDPAIHASLTQLPATRLIHKPLGIDELESVMLELFMQRESRAAQSLS